jgi:phospholipid transport system substrate-binding protein
MGLSWEAPPEAQKAPLETAFRRYTVSSYVANFGSYNGRRFQVSPARAIRDGEVVVQSRLLRIDGSSIALDYIMLRCSAGWQAVDVLTGSSLSRVAVQRSDFRKLLTTGGVPAVVADLGHKIADLSGGVEG